MNDRSRHPHPAASRGRLVSGFCERQSSSVGNAAAQTLRHLEPTFILRCGPAEDHALLVAEGFYGIEAGGFYGGVHAEEEADAHGDADSNHDGPQRDGGRQAGHYKMEDQADGTAEQYADDATGAGKHNCFGEELPDDVAATRAERFAYADFARALGHGHQHDIHHTDATNQKADGTDHGD